MSIRRLKIHVSGVVQGVGFRPFVWQLANELELVGSVCNQHSGVLIEVQGDARCVDQFVLRLKNEHPNLARIESIDLSAVPNEHDYQFVIKASTSYGRQVTAISPDVAICDDCLSELFDETDRRYQYPFINCTQCGPRFTIIQDLPYDRPSTTMRRFAMCSQCQLEYNDPADRRFHAQPNACPACGPTVWFVAIAAGQQSREYPVINRPAGHCGSEASIKAFKQAIRGGKIIAVKGVGGFHLACDATNDSVVQELRKRKGRVDKPFAVMVDDLQQAEQFAHIDQEEASLLRCRQRPIVLLRKRKHPEHSEKFHRTIADSVAPGNDFIGVMLPYSPLHHLLMDGFPLVMTSGNLTDEPIAHTNADAFGRLSDLADGFLMHDRDIHVVCDDSVVRQIDQELLPIRRSRGYAPMPVRIGGQNAAPVLAIGGEIKSTFCLTTAQHAIISQHIGDMGNIQTLESLQKNVNLFLKLYQIQPEAIAADLHPGYLSGQWAESFASQQRIPLIRIQHHFAHCAALLVDSESPLDEKMIGCCFDGTGYGTDGTIWGGEFLVADTFSFDRIAYVEPFPLPGGDASIRFPSRTALALLWAHDLDWDHRLPPVNFFDAGQRSVLRQQLEKNLNCAMTSSMGRLFDAVAALIGIRQRVNYEAQAAMEMESMAARAVRTIDRLDQQDGSYTFDMELVSGRGMKIGTRRLINAICQDVLRGAAAAEMSAKFHVAVVDMIVQVCEHARQQFDLHCVGLTGGVFQNVLLLGLAKRLLRDRGFRVLSHSTVPPNDGGLALGQAVIARNWLDSA